MKIALRFAVATSALMLGAVAAQAADLTYEPAPVAEAVTAYNWTGVYIGVHGGIGGGNFDNSVRYYDEPDFGVDLGDNAFGAFGGVQVGYNYQFAPNWVAGVEADFAASGIEADHSESYDGGVFRAEYEAKVDWFGTLRGRVGYAWDNVLFYGTGGAAYGKVKLSSSVAEDGNTLASSSASETNWGWTVGAGVEYGITKNITLKTEYLYVDLGSLTAENYVGPNDYGQAKLDVGFHTVKAGLNYKF